MNSATINEPTTWRALDAANKSYIGDDEFFKYICDKAMQDHLKCFNCRGSLSVGPFFYEKEHPNIMACGRCFRDPASAVHTREMLQDHMYENLLACFVLKCSCDEMIYYSQVEEHETTCPLKRQQPPAEEDLLEKNSHLIYFVNSNIDKLCLTLSCDLCTKPLSVFPVISNGDRIICGRCERPSLGEWTEQKIYSNMVGFVTIPCFYYNCTNLQSVEDVRQHDETCRWAARPCPLGCGRIYPIAEASIHIRKHHLHETLDRLEMKPQTALLQIEGEPFVVSVRRAVDEDQQSISCAVFGLDEKEYENLQMEIVDDDSGAVSRRSTVQIARLEQQVFYSTVQIEKKAHLRLVRVADTVGALALDRESSERFACPVCYSYMTRSIYKCVNGHPICDKCKVRIDESCPMCRGVLPADDRHSKLEEEAAAFKFPCAMQEEYNCNVTLTPERLIKHEVLCKWRDAFLTGNCILTKCSVELDSDKFNDFFNHCVQHHFDELMYTGSKEVLEWSTVAGGPPASASESLLFFDGEIFYVIFEFGEDTGLFVAVMHLEPKEWMLMPNLNTYKCTVQLQNTETCDVVEWSGMISEPSLAWTLNLNNGPDVVNRLAHVGQTSSWIQYRVKLEKTTPTFLNDDVNGDIGSNSDITDNDELDEEDPGVYLVIDENNNNIE